MIIVSWYIAKQVLKVVYTIFQQIVLDLEVFTSEFYLKVPCNFGLLSSQESYSIFIPYFHCKFTSIVFVLLLSL